MVTRGRTIRRHSNQRAQSVYTRVTRSHPSARATEQTVLPSNLSGLVVWSSADEITGKNNGDALTGWNDRSTGARHWVNLTASPQYRLTDGPGSTPCIRADSTTGTFQGPAANTIGAALTATSTGDVFMIVKSLAANSLGASWQWGTSAFSSHYHYNAENGSYYEDALRSTRPGYTAQWDMESWRLVNYTATGGVGTTTWKARVDGALFQDETLQIFGALSRPRLGEGISGSQTTGFYIAEVFVFDRVLTDTERDQMCAYVADKYTMMISLSTGAQVMAHWDASAIVGLSDADPITTWIDTGAHGYNATQATGANKPTYQTNEVNSLPCVRFDSSDFLDSAAPIGRKPITVACVIKANTSGVRTILGTPISTTFQWRINAGTPEIIRSGSGGAVATGALTNGAWTILVMTYSSLGVSGFFRNGTAIGTPTANFTSQPSTAQIGSRNSGTEGYADDIAEIILYDSVLTTTERNTITASLGTKYNITVV